jgi:hypothetical protein
LIERAKRQKEAEARRAAAQKQREQQSQQSADMYVCQRRRRSRVPSLINVHLGWRLGEVSYGRPASLSRVKLSHVSNLLVSLHSLTMSVLAPFPTLGCSREVSPAACELEEDPEAVLRACRVQEKLQERAILEEYLAQVTPKPMAKHNHYPNLCQSTIIV